MDYLDSDSPWVRMYARAVRDFLEHRQPDTPAPQFSHYDIDAEIAEAVWNSEERRFNRLYKPQHTVSNLSRALVWLVVLGLVALAVVGVIP